MASANPRITIEVEKPDVATLVAEYVLRILMTLFVLATLPFSIWNCGVLIKEYQRGVVLVLGRLKSEKPKAPGLHFTLPVVEEYKIIDMRMKTFDIPPQQIITKDSVTIGVDAVVFWKVFNAALKVAKVEDAEGNTVLLAQSTIRNILGTKTMAEILSQKEETSQEIQQYLDEATDVWGIKVEKVEIKDIKIPAQMQRSMAAEAEAEREARARVITADTEKTASMKLKQAADIMNDSPYAIHLRYLQTLTTVAGKQTKSIILPLPAKLVNKVLKRKTGSTRL